MSAEDREEILVAIRSVKAWAKGLILVITVFGMGITGAAFWVISVVTDDHYDQIALRKDSDWMKPKVTQLWYYGNKRPDQTN